MQFAIIVYTIAIIPVFVVVAAVTVDSWLPMTAKNHHNLPFGYAAVAPFCLLLLRITDAQTVCMVVHLIKDSTGTPSRKSFVKSTS